MRRRLIAVLLAAASLSQLLLAGCSGDQSPDKLTEEKNGKTEYDYQIYCVNEERTALKSWGYDMSSDDLPLDKVVDEVFAAFESQPENGEYYSARPEKIKKIAYILDDNVLKVNCDKYYDKLDSLSQLFFKAALVMTLTQIEGVEYIYITVKGQPLKDSSGNPVGYLSRDSFLTHEELAGAIGTTIYTTVYYPNEAGNGLIAENVYYIYYEQQSPAMYILDLLRERAGKSGNTVIPEDTAVKNIYVKAGICYIDFDEKFNASAFKDVEEEVLLYALVNSLCEIFEVTGVQITINGRSDVMFRDEISLNQIFRMNLNLVE